MYFQKNGIPTVDEIGPLTRFGNGGPGSGNFGHGGRPGKVGGSSSGGGNPSSGQKFSEKDKAKMQEVKEGAEALESSIRKSYDQSDSHWDGDDTTLSKIKKASKKIDSGDIDGAIKEYKSARGDTENLIDSATREYSKTDWAYVSTLEHIRDGLDVSIKGLEKIKKK